ncbi:hypothetical protein N7G274_010262 [Stereocaulon virgatum]|uniref:NACHT domain-containing protein n=1 Tax=Stereocaulon virgatum TaxID=373712 RepID=A0ABR3ZY19_9LECA
MGGLVIKRAYILAKQQEDYVPLADRVEAMFFLATPHRGSDLAPVFSKLLNLSGGARPFVTDLHRDSLAIQSINDEFPHCCQDLRLFSFYETLPTGYGVGTSIIVGRDLATLGYVNERSEYLNANHREVCKYASQDDPNYRTVRNALASVTHVLRSRLALTKQEISNDQRRLLNPFLGVSDAPEDDFMSVDSLRTSGSCEWLIEKTSFQQWLHHATPPIYWISAKPATGKTILSGKVISHLRGRHENCSFYFFHHGNKEKTSITSFLLSIAWQMAHLNKEVLDTVLQICEKDDHLNKADHRTVWRKLFLEGILKLHFDHTQYWVVDALDECKTELEVVSLLTKVAEVCSIRILVTSRNTYDSCRRVGLPKVQVASERIEEEDSRSDIALYIEANVDELPSVGGKGRQHIVRQILEKSVGCFLWVSLVFQELRKVHTSTDVQKVLDEVPTDMNALYARILDSMSTAAHGKSLAKAILTWTVCSTRPLKTSELYDALRLDLKDSIGSIEGSIGSSCGQLVYVDAQFHVQMIHLTARDFLRNSTYSEFAVDEKDGHRRLLMTCLQYLNGDEMKGARNRKLSASDTLQERSSFVSYASNSLFEHIAQVPSTDDDVIFTLASFFGSPNVFSWVEYIATHSDLNRLVQTGKAIGKFLRGCSPEAPKKDIALLNSWATDLVRLAIKFGRNLAACPSSIFSLIPPFCPPSTAPRKQFCISACTITVSGLRAETWDDCISTIINMRERYSSLASSETLFAIGTFSGKVILYEQTTCQEVGILQHGEPVRLLKLGDVANILVSAGSRKIRIWDLASKIYIWDFDTPQQCISLSLTDRDQLLLGCSKDHHLRIWSMNTGCLTEDVDWTQGLEGMTKQLHRRPIAAAFSADADLLAVIYKGQDILLWHLESDCLYDTFSRESGAIANPGRPYGSAGARCLVFLWRGQR